MLTETPTRPAPASQVKKKRSKNAAAADANAPEDPRLKSAYQATRKSLIERLKNWEDQKSWDEFYKTYWKLIYSVALKSGLRSDEAFDAVQEVILAIAKQQKEGKYDPNQGSFKAWLMNMTRWRITDQLRKRKKDTSMSQRSLSPDGDDRRTATLDRFEDPDGPELEKVWAAEWTRNLTDRALAAVKAKVSPKQFQIFDCYVVKGWAATRVTEELGVTIAQVYLAKHRVGGVLRKEIKGLENELL
ncbi:MAG: sigma-70 family RNA polymerase sigma factor [Verrucomicrobiota bacterium]